ncbi:MAG: hypothetical protein ICCCNLDF_01023 [Planctomycetes bacterium]|nr:hypothetical protein [Planctomycetota bacterium]
MDEQQHNQAEQEDPIDVEGLLLQVRRKDSRYRAAAYHFVLFQGIEYTLRRYLGVPQGQFRHMNGREICEGLRELALEEFGPLARDVWAWWGVNTTRDWGDIVFNLIEVGLLHAQDDDRPEHFDNIYDVDEALSPARVR